MGRKKVYLATLLIIIVATVAHAMSASTVYGAKKILNTCKRCNQSCHTAKDCSSTRPSICCRYRGYHSAHLLELHYGLRHWRRLPPICDNHERVLQHRMARRLLGSRLCHEGAPKSLTTPSAPSYTRYWP